MPQKSTIVIFSDLHYLPPHQKPVGNRKLTNQAEQMLEKLIQETIAIHPDFIVNLGDLIEDVNNSEQDLQNYTYIYQKLNNFPCPVYSIPGNHDLKTIDNRQTLEKIMGYHHSSYAFDYNETHFIFLGLEVNNNDIIDDGGISRTQYLSKEDIAWLEQELKNSKYPCIIFCHFGIAEDDMKDNWWFHQNKEEALLQNRAIVKKLFKKYHNVQAVFTGHQHWTKQLVEEDVHYYILGSMTENINNDNIPDRVYYIIELEQNRLKVIEQHLK